MARTRFRKPRTRRARSRWWRTTVRPLLLLAALVAVWWVTEPLMRAPESWEAVPASFGLCGERGGAACVIDGDTVWLAGKGDSPPRRIRLTGYDAPELKGACPAESAKAEEARRQLHSWLARGRFEWTGGADPPRDQYGRELRSARRVVADDGSETLAEHMIAKGLGEGSGWGAEAVDWCG